MATFTVVQMALLAMIVFYAYSVRKMNKAVVTTAVFAVGLLHMYDHLYLLKRGDERLIFSPKSEGYSQVAKKRRRE